MNITCSIAVNKHCIIEIKTLVTTNKRNCSTTFLIFVVHRLETTIWISTEAPRYLQCILYIIHRTICIRAWIDRVIKLRLSQFSGDYLSDWKPSECLSIRRAMLLTLFNSYASIPAGILVYLLLFSWHFCSTSVV